MAGFYPDAPAPRIMYDVDGTAMYWAQDNGGVVGGTITPVNLSEMQTMNDDGESSHSGGSGSRAFIILFPVLMDVAAYHYASRYSWSVSGYGPSSIEASSDTTNGIDGTWTTVAASVTGNSSSNVIPTYRTMITSLNANGVIALRLRGFSQYQHIRALHLYGGPTAATNDMLSFWHPTLDQGLGGADMDFGDVPQGDTSTKSFRIKNLSSSLTANSISLSDGTLTDFSPSVPLQYEYSNDGGATYSQTLSIGNLAPGATSGAVIARKTTPGNAALGLHTITITVQAASWS